MIALEVARISLASILAHKLRSFLNLFGIIVAVTTIVAVISVVSGLNEYAANLIGQLGPNTFVVSKFGIIASREEFLRAIRRKDLTDDDVEAVRRLVPKALRVTGRIFGSKAVYGDGRRLADTIIAGAGPEFPWMVGIELQDGRFFTEGEAGASRAVAVIGTDVKDELFPHVDPIGRMVAVDGKPFRVIGLTVKQGRALGQSQDKFVFVPIGAYEKAFGRSQTVDIFVEAPDSASRAAVLEATRVALRARRGTGFRDPDPFGVVDAEALNALWKNLTFAGFALVIWISSISLLVGGVAIANTMFAAVIERTHEIGVRKAVGARGRDVRLQFLLEAATLSFLGGVVGVLLGWAASAAVEGLTPFPARVTPLLVLSGLAVSTLSGVLAGWLPAIRASRLDPVEALREE
ncbi:MAG: ABC transporter permease [Acidobacteriia bacterium]|nr:ABC transporter permease [Terriglobia bacterium]